jgi:hypothetical protein
VYKLQDPHNLDSPPSHRPPSQQTEGHSLRLQDRRITFRLPTKHNMSLLHSAGPLFGPPKLRRSERQTKLPRARSIVSRKHMNSWLDAVVSSREGKRSLLRRDVVPNDTSVLPAVNPLPGSLPSEHVSLPPNPRGICSFTPKIHNNLARSLQLSTSSTE